MFTSDPDAPMSAVAARAGVGISALYRRYASKEDLLRQVARDGLARYLDEAEAAVADDSDAWEAFAAFMARLLDAQTVAITMNLAGTFAPNEELYAMSVRAAELNARIVERTKAAGGLRADVVVDDLSLILEQVSSIRLGDEATDARAPAPLPGAVPRRAAVGRRGAAARSAAVTRRARLEVVAPIRHPSGVPAPIEARRPGEGPPPGPGH